MARIAAAICTWNRYDVLPKAIESVAKQSLGKHEYKIFVIDNSPDHDYCEEFGKQFAHIENLEYVVEKIAGLSNARNVATRMCAEQGIDYIAYLDDDAIARPEWLEKILEGFDSFGEEVDVVGGRVDPMWSMPRPRWLGPKLEGYVSIVNWGGELRLAEESEWFAGTNIAFRVDTLQVLGGFSTTLGRTGSGATLLSNEETQLLDRIKETGGKRVYHPDAALDHLVEEKRLSRQWFRKRMAWQATSDFLMKAEECIEQCAGHWQNILEYSAMVPPRERTLRGLMYDTDDAELFHWQLSAIYGWNVLNLAGFEGVAEEEVA